MINFKEFLNERSAKELADEILTLKNTKILNKVDTVLQSATIEKIISKILKDKNFPNKADRKIHNFFTINESTVEEKIELLQALEEGMIKKIAPGKGNLKDLIDPSYKITNTKLFYDFCETLGGIKDSKSTQGSTGTGAGEVLLCMLTKDGFLPTSKGDVNIIGRGMEIKSSNGRIAAFRSVEPNETADFIRKHFKEEIPNIKNLEGLMEYLRRKDSKEVQDFLYDFFNSRSTKKEYSKIIKKALREYDTKKCDKKELQTVFGEHFLEFYQNEEGWDGIIAFKKSSDFLNTKIAIGYGPKEFRTFFNFSHLTMTNGNQDSYLVVKS